MSCQLYQRSTDIFLGAPFNFASYALLTHMLAQQCEMDVGDFIWTGDDCHIYGNHHDQVRTQLARGPRPYPTLVIKRRPASIFDYEFEDFAVEGYDPHPVIKGAVAVQPVRVLIVCGARRSSARAKPQAARRQTP